jgi:serine O-acetyltransferase
MIQSKSDYRFYLEADRKALGVKFTWRELLFNDVWKFQRCLRLLEYLTNCKKNLILRKIIAMRFRYLSKKLGFTIPINVFDSGLSIAHYGTIVVNGNCKIGKNCRIYVCVNIGSEAGKAYAAPEIGDNCYIGPGAKLFGSIKIGDNTAIGANAVVNKSFPEGNITIGGVPAKMISNKNTKGLL